MSRKTSAVVGGQTGTKDQYNFSRDEATGSSWLLAYGTSVLKVMINAGVVYFEGSKVEFAGGLSPILTDPTASSRIDIISLNSSNTIIVTEGTEADTPTAPNAPANQMPICEVYNRSGETVINDTDTDGSEGYINKDLRKFLRLPRLASLTAKGVSEEATASEINAGTQAGGTSAELLVNPKYLKDSEYYTRRPTSDEKAALPGTGTPNTSNKYVTDDDTSNATTANKVVRYTAGGDVNVPTIPGASQDATSKDYVDDRDLGVIKYNDLTSDSISGAGPTVLKTYTIPANVLGSNKGLHIRVTGRRVGGGTPSTESYAIKFGGTTIGGATLPGADLDHRVVIDILLYNTATNVQVFNSIANKIVGTVATRPEITTRATAAIDTTGDVDLTVEVTAGHVADTVYVECLFVELLNEPR